MTRTVITLSIAGAVLAMGPLVHARTAVPVDHQPGIYLSKGADAPIKIKYTIVSDVRQKGLGKALLTQGFSKPTMEAHIPGDKADLRIASGDVSFFAYLDPNADARRQQKMQQMSPSEMMAGGMGGMGGDGNDMPGAVKTDKDLVLVHLRIDGGERICSVKAGGGAIDGVGLTSEKLATNEYKLTPKAPLEPGEYALIPIKNGGMGQYWMFGVGGSK